jgi:hypothetical protein
MSSRAPLCLLYDRYLKEWRCFQSEAAVRGRSSPGAIFLRQPTPAEEQTVKLAVSDHPDNIWHLQLPDPDQLKTPWVRRFAECAEGTHDYKVTGGQPGSWSLTCSVCGDTDISLD